MHCSTAQGKMSSPVCSAALQKRLAACTFSLWLHLCRFFFIQVCSGPAPMHCSPAQSRMSSPVFSAALQKQAHSLHCVTVFIPMQICSSYRYAVSQHRCTAALPRAKLSSPVFSAALQKRLAACTFSLWLHLCRFFFIQVCSEPAPMHCSTAQSKMSSPVFSAALQNRLTACTLSLCLHLCRFALHTGMQ